MPHEKELPAHLFWWQSADGSRLMAFRIPFAYTYWGDDLESHARDCVAEIHAPLDEMMCFYGVGQPRWWADDPAHRAYPAPGGRSKFPGASVFFDTGEPFSRPRNPKAGQFPPYKTNYSTTQAGVMLLIRASNDGTARPKTALLAAEKWSLVAHWTTGQPYPTDFGRAWKNVLFNQFHDTMAGTAIEAAYDDARDTYGEALAIADRALTAAVQSLAWRVNIPAVDGNIPLVVFNPLAFPVKAPIEMESKRWLPEAVLVDDAGRTIPHQSVQPATTAGRARLAFMAEIPALGYRTYTLTIASIPCRKI